MNGIRSALSKGLAQWLKAVNADIVCLQEIKANREDIPVEQFEDLGYYHYWHPAQKRGYSGVGILSRTEPQHVEYGSGMSAYDDEGRILRADFDRFSVMSLYAPSGTAGDERQDFKYRFLGDFQRYVNDLKRKIPRMIISGDYNICHRPIDIHNPVSNAHSSGFLPEEREWIDQFMKSGFIDTFRHFSSEPHNYTWWSFRAGSRDKNLGWRIDYHLASRALEKELSRAAILPEARHSDHCPILLETAY